MLARHLRLRSPQEFQAVWQQGERWPGRLLSLSVMANNLANNRYGLVVSKRVGGAVVRNRVKRRLRAAIREWFPPLATGYDIVIITHPPASQAPYIELEAELGRLLRRAGLLMANR